MSQRPGSASHTVDASIDQAADWIAAAVRGGKVRECRDRVRDRAIIVLVGLADEPPTVVIPHEGVCNLADRRVK